MLVVDNTNARYWIVKGEEWEYAQLAIKASRTIYAQEINFKIIEEWDEEQEEEASAYLKKSHYNLKDKKELYRFCNYILKYR